MPLAGRIEGRKSADGLTYEVRQGETVLRTFSIDEARNDRKLAAAIKRNGWESI